MQELISDKDIRVASLNGTVMRLTAGKPKTPPNDDLFRLALAQGAKVVGKAKEPSFQIVTETPSEELIYEEVKATVQGVFEEGDRKQLSVDGSPKMTVVKKAVPDATVEMRDRAMRELAQS